MSVEVVMPLVAAEDDEGVVTAWLVEEGSRVSEGQVVAEAQTEKVSVDVTAPRAGVVERLLVAINEPVLPGTPICVIGDSAVAAPAETARPEGVVGKLRERAAPPASPAARRVARELGVDLATVEGTGAGGRITEDDVRAATAEPAKAAGERVGRTGLRAAIARNMRASHERTAAVTLTTTVDVTDSLPERYVTAWIVKGSALALRDHPHLNGVQVGDEFAPAASADVAVAIQTERGLVAPVVRGPASRPLDEVAGEIAALAERAAAGSLEAADFAGGTFTVTNLGSYGIDAFTPIVNLPQVAVLGVGAVRTQPGFAADGQVVPRRRLTLSLTFDHAFVDGAPAAAFLADLTRLLETPGSVA